MTVFENLCMSFQSLAIEGDVSGVDVSNVTIGRGSVKILRSRKVSFVTPDITPRTPRRSNLRLRPKTPIASHDGNISLVDEDIREQKPADISLHMTPKPDDEIICKYWIVRTKKGGKTFIFFIK